MYVLYILLTDPKYKVYQLLGGRCIPSALIPCVTIAGSRDIWTRKRNILRVTNARQWKFTGRHSAAAAYRG
jgi:hypothetical protein